jgi:manganese transport protein
MSDSHSTTDVALIGGQGHEPRAVRGSRRNILGIIGPALMVSVGYMDPGNWATDLEGGARFGYSLLWVLLVSNAIALLLQGLSARLGIVSGLDLASGCRERYPAGLANALWGLAEIAIIACDLAELLGSAVALKLLFGLPLAMGAALTSLDVLLILALERRGKRRIEAVVLSLLITIAVCMLIELCFAAPSGRAVVSGFVPHLNSGSLYVAIGILGATVMPHNLYLHSGLSAQAAPKDQARALRNSNLTTTVALNVAMLVNAAILIVAAAAFHGRGLETVTLEDAHRLLAPLLGSALAPILFAVALLCAGQSASISGTLAGQYVMEGFWRVRISPALRRLITRTLALVPALLTLLIMGEGSVMSMLVASQVVLSLQLPFAVVPLIRLTSSTAVLGERVISARTRALAIASAIVIVGANTALVLGLIAELRQSAPAAAVLLMVAGSAALLLLVFVARAPLRGTSVSTPQALIERIQV